MPPPTSQETAPANLVPASDLTLGRKGERERRHLLFSAREIEESSVVWHRHMCFKGRHVARLYMFGTFAFSELQYIQDLNILFIPDKFSLTLWNPQTEIYQGLNQIEVNETEALFVCEQITLHLFITSNLKL